MANLTPTQQKIYDLLSDGEPHRREEIHSCLWDELSPMSNINPHISNLRRNLPRGLLVACVKNKEQNIAYQLVRHLNSPYDGRS